MLYEFNLIAVAIFGLFVAITLRPELLSRAAGASRPAGISRPGAAFTGSSTAIAFAGDYLSAASFLGICGMIAFYGYDGFLYSIGYLAGWVVALFVIAEPLKRMGKYTFADALDSAVQLAGHQALGGDQHAGREHLLSDSADGRRRGAGQAAAGLSALGRASSWSARS